MRDTRGPRERSGPPTPHARKHSRSRSPFDRLRREQTNRLLGLALQLHARKRCADAIWFGRLAQVLDPSNQRATAYLRLFRSPLFLVISQPDPAHP